MVDMSKNLLKAIMDEKPKPAFSVKGLIEKINTGYLPEETVRFSKKKSFSPSALAYGPGGGQCPRRWFLAFNGGNFANDVDAYAAANMKNGSDAHARIQGAMRKSGVLVQDEVKLIHKDPPISAFADALINWDEESMPAEIKIMREESFQYRTKNAAAEYHLIQLLMYMALMKKRKGVLIYESKNSHVLHAEPVVMGEREQKFIDDAFEWMRTVYKAYEDNQLPKKPYRSNSKVCKRCPLAAQCAEAGVGDVKIAPMVGLSD